MKRVIRRITQIPQIKTPNVIYPLAWLHSNLCNLRNLRNLRMTFFEENLWKSKKLACSAAA